MFIRWNMAERKKNLCEKNKRDVKQWIKDKKEKRPGIKDKISKKLKN